MAHGLLMPGASITRDLPSVGVSEANLVSTVVLWDEGQRGLYDTLESARALGDNAQVVVVAKAMPAWTRHYAQQCGYELTCLELSANDAISVSDQLRAHLHTPWLFWLLAGETISGEVAEQLRELVRIPAGDGPAAYSLVIQQRTTPCDVHAGLRLADVVRLQRRVWWDAKSTETQFDRFRWSLDVAWTDLVINSPPPHAFNDSYEQPMNDEGKQRCDVLRELAEGLLPHESEDDLGLLEGEILGTQAASSRIEKTSAAIALMRRYNKRDNATQSIAIAEHIHTTCPLHSEVSLLEGVAWHCQGELSRALGCYRAAFSGQRWRGFAWWDTTVPHKALHNAAVAYYEQGDDERAEHCFREVLRVVWGFHAAHAGLRRLLLATERYEAAHKWGSVLTARDDLFGDGVVLLAEIQRRTGQEGAAICQLEQALRRQPDCSRLLLALAEHYLFEGQTSDALVIVDELIRTARHLAVAHFWRGHLMYLVGRVEDAAAAWSVCGNMDSRFHIARDRLRELQTGAVIHLEEGERGQLPLELVM